jgi:diguanylate cyclase (GGDEF)-like protein
VSGFRANEAHDGRSAPARWWRRLWRSPDPIVVDAGSGGELFVARLRFALTAALLVIPAVSLRVTDGAASVNLVGLAIAMVATVVAGAILSLVAGGYYRPWLALMTGLVDVTLISFALAAYIVSGRPDIATNSYVVYPIYLLAIAATVLRYDARTSIATGLLAMLQYGGIVAYAAATWDINGPAFAPHPYGFFDWSTQVGRIILLGATTALATAAVVRSGHWLKQSASDRLTGLLNRGFFDDRLEVEFLRARRYNRPVAVAMIDIDHFKQFNDLYGHAVGDAVLKLVAEQISAGLRRTDVVARYGGEEFAAILPETDRDSAAQKAEMLRQAVEEATVAVRKAIGPVGVTISVGVASWPDDGTTIQDVLDAADRRLYNAKQKGRNRVSGAIARIIA